MATEFAGVMCEEALYRRTKFYYCGDGLHYTLSQVSEDRREAAFECLLSGTRGCPGRAVWLEGFGMRHTVLHNHLPSPLYPEEVKLKRKILTCIKSGQYSSYADIYRQESSQFSVAVQARVTLTRMIIEMKLARLSLCPFNPTSLENLARIFGDRFYRVMSLSVDGQENLFCTYSQLPDGTGCIVFASMRMTDFLSHATHIYCDSSHTTPTPHFLVLSISTVHNGFFVPVLHCLFLRKSFLGYQSIINHFKRLNPHFLPQTVITGFDDDLAAAWIALFPTIRCLNRTSFHFVNSIMESVKELHLSSSFRNNVNVTRAVEACCLINMCPHDLMHEAFTCIVNKTRQLNVFNQLRPLFNYVWTSWLNGVRFTNKEVSVCANVECTMNTFELLHHMMRTEKVSMLGSIFFFVGGLASIEDIAARDVQLLLSAQLPCRDRKAMSLATSSRVSDYTTDLSMGRIHVSEFIEKLSPLVRSLCGALL